MFGKPKLKLYREKELAAVEAHITKYFGAYEQVFHEIVSNDIHCDILHIPPSPERDFITLVTLGAGAHKMNLPKQYRKSHFSFSRAEYLLTLPADWNLEGAALENIQNYWPMKALKDAARLPIWAKTWLSYTHTVSRDEKNSPYAENTSLCSVLLSFPEQFGDDAGSLCATLPNGEKVAFWQLIPIYESELLFARKGNDSNAEKLFELLGDIIKEPLNITRKSVV